MDKYGLIGYPLGHSFSISYFNQRFHDEDIDAVYENFEIPTIDILPEVLSQNPELKGLNVTIPYKEKVIPFLDSISPEARAIGAVNVIRVIHEGKNIKLKGYNSDVIGFTQSIEPMLEKKWHKKALILGTGGASKAIDYGLRNLGLETVFVSRYERPGTIQYERITPEVVKEYNVIVNCTPLGRRDAVYAQGCCTRCTSEERTGNAAPAGFCLVGVLARKQITLCLAVLPPRPKQKCNGRIYRENRRTDPSVQRRHQCAGGFI